MTRGWSLLKASMISASSSMLRSSPQPMETAPVRTSSDWQSSIFAFPDRSTSSCARRRKSIPSDSELCFRPLEPKVEAALYLVWKKYQIVTKPAKVFLEQVQKDLFQSQTY